MMISITQIKTYVFRNLFKARLSVFFPFPLVSLAKIEYNTPDPP